MYNSGNSGAKARRLVALKRKFGPQEQLPIEFFFVLAAVESHAVFIYVEIAADEFRSRTLELVEERESSAAEKLETRIRGDQRIYQDGGRKQRRIGYESKVRKDVLARDIAGIHVVVGRITAPERQPAHQENERQKGAQKKMAHIRKRLLVERRRPAQRSRCA